MLKFKQFGVAAATALIAVSAMASNFRAADQVYLPVVGHVTGASGTFVSDVWISNLSSDPVTVTMIFASTAAGTQTPNLPTIQLLPKERKEFIDFFGSGALNQTGLGQIIFNACKQGADCGPATQDANGVSPNFRNITVESRIYVGSPTNGQDFAGIPWYNFVSSDQAANNLHQVQIVGIRNTGGVGATGTYRTNIGLVNASQYSNTTLRVQLFAGNGTAIGTPFTQALGPLGQVQVGIGAMFPTFTGASATNAYVIVDQIASTPTSDAPQSCLPNGCPGFFTYGSALDNGNSAPTTLEAQYLIPLSDAAILAIYPNGSGKTTLRRAAHH